MPQQAVDARAGGSLNAVRQAKGTRTGNRFTRTRTAQARPRSADMYGKLKRGRSDGCDCR